MNKLGNELICTELSVYYIRCIAICMHGNIEVNPTEICEQRTLVSSLRHREKTKSRLVQNKSNIVVDISAVIECPERKCLCYFFSQCFL